MASKSTSSSKEKYCSLCNSESSVEMDMGELKKGKKYQAHYYCMVRDFFLLKKKNQISIIFIYLFIYVLFIIKLLSSNLITRDEIIQGPNICGFLESDIAAEIRRTKHHVRLN